MTVWGNILQVRGNILNSNTLHNCTSYNNTKYKRQATLGPLGPRGCPGKLKKTAYSTKQPPRGQA